MSEDSLSNLADQLSAEAEAMEDQSAAAASEGDGGAAKNIGGGRGGSSGRGSDDDAGDRNLSLIMDIPLRVSVELGRTKMPVSELLKLGQGSVVELNKIAGEPLEVLVNDKLIARGEAVVVHEKFGVRLIDIISPAERVEQLK